MAVEREAVQYHLIHLTPLKDVSRVSHDDGFVTTCDDGEGQKQSIGSTAAAFTRIFYPSAAVLYRISIK